MEERHSLSEPRLCPTATDHNLAWEVDVYRENVPDPIETLRIDDETLPPRMRKGKVVWRLPTDPGKLPSFGTDERRRIMELFKEKKKSRRKKKQEKQNVSDQDPEVKVTTNSPKRSISKGSIDIGGSSLKDTGVDSTSEQSPTLENSKDKKKNKNSKKGNSISNKGSNESKSEKDQNGPLTDVNEVQGPDKNNKIQDHNLHANGDSSSSPGPPGFNRSSPQPEQPSIPPRQYIHVTCEASMKPTTAAAKSFISIYYQSLTNGLTKDLCSYYHLNSQKSISVGGAHSVVTGLDSISMQIASLSGCLFNVRGVVAQDAANGGAHLLISGVCTPKGGFVTAFAHSIGLARIDEEHITGLNSNPKTDTNSLISAKFLIQNDALSLLNGEMAFAVEQQQQQQQQQMNQQNSFLGENNGIHQHQGDIGRHLYSGNQQTSSLLKPPGLFG